jgi:hypothetical protein
MAYRSLFVGLAAALAIAPPLHAAEGDQPLSPAQTALFDSDHLKSIVSPTVVQYSFTEDAGAESFSDSVAIGIEPRADGSKDVRVDFLSGDRRMPFEPVAGFHGNPVLMFFLEHDVAEMSKATGGSKLYFRNRIRQAFLDRAEVQSISFPFQGREERGTDITLTPFRNDPMIARFESFREKSYRFILADAVPGAIYQIRTLVPAGGAAQGTREATMTFAGTRGCQGSEGCAPSISSPP